MEGVAQHQSDLECAVSINGSEFAQSSWSYLYPSLPTEDWVDPVEDVFMGSEQDLVTAYENISDGLSHREGIAGRNPTVYPELAFLSTDAPFVDAMNSDPGSDRDCVPFHDEIPAYSAGASGDASSLSSSPHHSGTYPTSNEPWNPVGPLRVIQYDAGFVTFVDSKRSSSDQNLYDTSPVTSLSPWETTIQPSQGPDVGNFSPESAEMKNQQHLQWVVNSMPMHSLPKTDQVVLRETNRCQPRGRHGPLNSQKAREARIMRKLGVCWPCRVLKVKCSPGNPCEACGEHGASLSHLTYRVCCRSGFADYGTLYFPKVLTSHFARSEVEDLVARNVEHFIGIGRDVNIHCGRSFTPMELKKERMIKIVLMRSAPVGIMGIDLRHLKKKCKLYIESMVSHPDYTRQVTAGGKSEIYYRALEVIHCYSRAEKNRLLDKVMQLHAMHHFMTKILTFTKDSASMVTRVSQKSLGMNFPSDVISSRLLNRQVKFAMYALHQAETETVLEDFERLLKKREVAGWPLSFCVVIILCLCMEDVQIAVNNFVFNDADKSQDIRSDSDLACWELEDKPYRQYTQLFHDMYRSYKQPNSHVAEGGFNPILKSCNHQTDWSQATQDMVSGIRQIIHDFEVEMRTLSMVSSFDDHPQEGHQTFQRDHPARLLSKFLLSFIDGS